jgi:hypothetical protein
MELLRFLYDHWIITLIFGWGFFVGLAAIAAVARGDSCKCEDEK